MQFRINLQQIMNKYLIIILTFNTLFCKAQDLPHVNFGTLERIENFETELIEHRKIDIWLPENFDKENKYPVVYMHDGQMLFDASETWNKTAWDVDDTFGQLIEEGKIKECIVVGI